MCCLCDLHLLCTETAVASHTHFPLAASADVQESSTASGNAAYVTAIKSRWSSANCIITVWFSTRTLSQVWFLQCVVDAAEIPSQSESTRLIEPAEASSLEPSSSWRLQSCEGKNKSDIYKLQIFQVFTADCRKPMFFLFFFDEHKLQQVQNVNVCLKLCKLIL